MILKEGYIIMILKEDQVKIIIKGKNVESITCSNRTDCVETIGGSTLTIHAVHPPHKVVHLPKWRCYQRKRLCTQRTACVATVIGCALTKRKVRTSCSQDCALAEEAVSLIMLSGYSMRLYLTEQAVWLQHEAVSH